MNSVCLIIYPASDVAKTKSFFATLLGTDPYVDSKPYTGFKTGEMEIGIVPKRPDGSPASAIAYVTVGDINAALQTLIAAGAQARQPVTDVGGGLLVASVEDPDGTLVGLRQFPAG